MDGVLERLAREVALGVGVALVAAACATGPIKACEKQTIVVAQKEARTRVDVRRTTRTTATGGIEEVSEPVSLREYWARTDSGRWHQITEAEFEAVVPGQRIEVCR